MLNDDWQPELFQEYQPPARPPWWSRYLKMPQRQVALTLAQEDLILAAIGGVMIVVIGFCLGVERGKRLGDEPAAEVRPPAAAVLPAVAVPVVQPPAVAVPLQQHVQELPQKTRVAQVPAAQGQVASQVTATPNGAYVVQLASYSNAQEADNAKRRLTQRGIPASIVQKGKYRVLYAGKFATYAQATEAAGQLKSAYRDCFVKKLTTDQRG